MNFQIARTNMVVQQVRPWQVFNEKVINVLAQIPRESFVPLDYLNLAYSDIDIPLNKKQTMLSPKIVGRALQALNLTETDKVLEIGTGTGYVTACLSKLCAQVVSVEIQETLITHATTNLDALHFHNLILEKGDAVFGWKKHAPYDAILITGSYPLGVPEELLEQLNPQGRLFAFIGVPPTMNAILIEKRGEKEFFTQQLFETVVPALIHAPLPKKFQF